MKPNEVQDIYTESYAKEYNEKFLLNSFSDLNTNFEFSLLTDLITSQTNWLDIGCGTGYFLSRFPGISRAGLDLSPTMLQEAKKVNPDALFFREGDFRNDFPEWKEKWSLVTCMWCAYSYVDSMREIDQVISNMINWTSTGGTVFIPLLGIEDFRLNADITYEEKVEMYNGTVQINGFIWTWVENGTGITHRNMIAPHPEHLIQLLAPFFETVELIRYPVYPQVPISRKVIVAKGKISAGSNQKANIIIHKPVLPVQARRSELSNKQLLNELLLRFRSGSLLRSILRKMRIR